MTEEAKIEQIKKELEAGKRLTTHGVFEKYKYSRLSDVVFRLNNRFMADKSYSGKLITTEWKKNEKTGKRYIEYFIPQTV